MVAADVGAASMSRADQAAIMTLALGIARSEVKADRRRAGLRSLLSSAELTHLALARQHDPAIIARAAHMHDRIKASIIAKHAHASRRPVHKLANMDTGAKPSATSVPSVHNSVP